MICVIDDTNKEKLRSLLKSELDKLMASKGEFIPKDYISNLYSRLIKNKPQEKSLAYTQLVPGYIRNIFRAYPALEDYFTDKGLSLDELRSLDKTFSQSLDNVSDYIGKNQGVISSVQSSEVIAQKVITQSGFNPNPSPEVIPPAFHAAPVNALSTTGQEALPGNIPDPSKVTQYAFQRKVINEVLTKGDSTQLDTPLYLTAMKASEIPGYTPGSPNEVVYAITDKDGKLSPQDGEVMFYPSRDIIKDGGTYSSKSDLAPVSSIIKSYQKQGTSITKAQAEQIRQDQLKQNYDINEFVNKGNKVITIITGGSLGYTNYGQSIKTSLAQVNFSDSPLLVKIQDQEGDPFYAGAAYFEVKGIQDPVLLQRNEMSGELIDKLISTILDPISETHAGKTHSLNAATRLALVKQYLNTTPSFMITLEGDSLVLHLKGEPVDLSKTEETRALLKDYFTNYSPTPGFDQSKIDERQKLNAIEDKPGFQSSLYQGAIVKSTDQSGKVFYQKYTKPAFNINNDFVKNSTHFDDYSLEKQADGSYLFKSNPTEYYNWLKKNTYINYELNKDGKILALNSYFTFQLTPDARKTLYPEPKQEANPVSPGNSIIGSNPTLPVSNAIQSFIDRVKKEGLKKEVPGLKATEEKVQEAKRWYDNHPLSKFFPYERLFNVINSDQIAKWTIHGITLYQGSDYSDLYHEAFHGFTQTFLSPAEQENLYKEVQKMSGSFTNHKGQKVKFKEASYLEIEEFLAEDFRKYMLSNGKTLLGQPVRNTLFRRLWNALKTLFGNTTQAQILINQQSINIVKELYEKLRVGDINEESFAFSNPSFNTLTKGPKATDPKDEVQELSPDQSILAVNTIDSLFSSFVDEFNKQSTPENKITNHIFATEAGRTAAYESVLTALKDRRKTLFWENTKETNPLIKNSNIRNIQTLDWMINNFGDTSDPRALKSEDGLIAYHNRKSKFLSYEDKYLDAEDKNTPESYNFKDGNETSVFEKGRPEVWYLIRGLHKLDKSGSPVLNRLGFPELVDFSSTKNRLIKTLQDSYDRQEMQERLVEVQKKYPFVNQLLNKLGDPDSTEKYTFGIWNSFFQTFNRYREPQQTVIFDKQGNQFIAKVGEAYGDHKLVQRSWDQLFSAGLSGDPKLVIKKGNAHPYLDVQAVLNKYPRINRTNFLQFLNDIGVNIDKDNEDIQREVKEDPSYDKIGGYLKDRLLALQKQKITVDSLNTLFKKPVLNKFNEEKNESSRYDQIARLQIKYSDSFANFQVTTPTGDTRYEHSLNASMTTVAKHLNRSLNYQDLLKTSLAYLDTARNPFSNVSKQLQAMFDKDGNRTDIKYLIDNISGTSLTEDGESTDNGTSSAGADQYTKLVQDIHLAFFKGVFENPRHGEKSTSLSTRPAKYNTPYSKDKRLWMGPENFTPGDESLYKKIYNSIIPYLYAEHNRIVTMNNLKPGDAELNYPEYVKNGKNFVMFDDILSKTTKDKIMKLGNLQADMTPQVEQLIDQDFRKYWDNQFDQMISQFNKAPFLSDNLISNLTTGKDNPLSKYKSDKRALGNILVKAFTFNSWIHNTESTILNYSDIAQYKTAIDFHKRIAMFSSTGDIFSTDNTTLGYINNQGMLYARKNNLPEKTFSDQLGTAVMTDPVLTSAYIKQITDGLREGLKKDWDQSGKTYTQAELDTEANKQAQAYQDMKIGDAQGWITFDSYRALSIAVDKWSEKQEDLYNRIVNGEVIDPNQALEYFPVRKYQYAGPLKTPLGLPVMAGHKFSLMPLVPSVIKGSPVLESLHHKMISQGIDYATLHSGSKITTVTNQGQMDKMYSDFTSRTFDNTPFTVNTVYLDFLKDQQDINKEWKGNAIFSTQLRKVIEEGLIEGGVPTDFMTGTHLDARRAAWNKLTETQKLKSDKYRLYKTYEDSISRLTEKKKQALLKEIGWDKPETYGKVNDKLIELVQKELTRQDISDHELDYIKLKNALSNDLKYGDLSIHLTAEKIEKLLSSLVNRKLVRQKISGEPLVQVSGLGWEAQGKFTNATQADLEKYGSNDLPFYEHGKGKDGKTSAMKVKVALHGNFSKLLKLKDNQGNTIGTRERLNELLKDETWLNSGDNRRMITMIGTRIPIQGLNSMEFMEVHEFLPQEAGNIIIPPAEIVAKSGSDFDIDKLTVMIPNIRESKEGDVSLFKNLSEKEARPLYDQYKKEITKKENLDSPEAYDKLFNTIFGFSAADLAEEQEQVLFEEGKIKPFDQFFKELNSNTKQEENEVMQNMRAILEHPDNYASLVRPNATFTLGPIADDKFRSQVSEYDPKQGQSKVSGSRLMEYQYNLYVHQINKVAKEALAIAAVDNTFNIMFNRVGAYMNEFYNDKNSNMSAKEAIRKDIKLYFRTSDGKDAYNTLIDPHGKKVISLSHVMDAEGKHRISDNVSQIINLLLEIAKNDSAYYLQLNKETIPTLLFLNQAGVPIDTLEYLVSQPIIRDYMDEIRQAKSPIADPLGKAPSKWQFFQLQARAEMIKKYFPEMEFPFTPKDSDVVIYNTRTKKAIPEIYKRTTELAKANPEAFTREYLKGNLDNTNHFDNKDKAILLHWFEIEDMAKAIRDIKIRLNPDTKKSGSAFVAMNKDINIQLLEQDQRIPDSIVKNLLEQSPISSFGTIGQFMIDFLKPLFPTRANVTIGNFLLSKIQSPQAREEIENTFGDVDKFSGKFFNDLISYVFQNKLRDFNPRSTQYRNMNTQEPIDVQQIPYLKYGAFVKDGTLYYDLDRMIQDFTQKNYTSQSYKDRGLATLLPRTFSTAKEFYNFVFEREYLRSYIKPNDIQDDPTYKDLLTQNKGDSQASYEQYLRDRALENIGNGWKLFESDNSYASQVIQSIQQNNLTDQFPLLNTLTISESKKSGMQNLQLLDTDLTSDKIDAFHRILTQLADPNVSKVPDEKTNTIISNLFQKFPMVAFLQSGLNTSGSFSLTRLVPAGNFMDFMSGAVKQFTDNLSVPKLERFYKSFLALNQRSATRNRYKDYTAQDPTIGIKAITKDPITIYQTNPDYFNYQPGLLTEAQAVSATENNPNLVFVYDKSIDKQGVNPGVTGVFSSKKITSNNTLGLPTLTSYAELSGKSLTDKTLESNKTLIDQSIKDLKDLQDSGLEIAFSTNGYGQGLIGLKQDGVTQLSKDKPGFKTFLYLSAQLYDNFNFVNKNYDLIQTEETPTPAEVLAKGSPVSDSEVRDQIRNCQ